MFPCYKTISYFSLTSSETTIFVTLLITTKDKPSTRAYLRVACDRSASSYFEQPVQVPKTASVFVSTFHCPPSRIFNHSTHWRLNIRPPKPTHSTSSHVEFLGITMTTRRSTKLKSWQQRALKSGRTPLPEFPGNKLWTPGTHSTSSPSSEKRVYSERSRIENKKMK